MRVLQINTVYENGGSTGRIVADLVAEQRDANIEPFVAYGYGRQLTKADRGWVYRITSNFDLFVSKVLTKIFGRHGFDNVSETKRLLKWIDSVGPDIIHLHNIHNHYVNIEMLLNYIAERHIKTFLTMHDCWTFTGWCAYFDYPKCDKWKVHCRECTCLNKYPRTFIFDRSESNFDRKKSLFEKVDLTIVTPSQWLADLVGQSFLKDKTVIVINNGTDLTKFYHEESEIKKDLGIEADKKVILGMAFNFEERKGISYFFKLNQLFADKCKVVLVGVPEKMKKNVPDGIICVSLTNDVNLLRRLYSMADVFVNPTLEDNFPTTNIESLACGTPVVTFRTGGSPEAIDEKTGAVVKPGHVAELESAIRNILLQERNYLIKECRSRAEAKFDKHKQYGCYINLYKI